MKKSSWTYWTLLSILVALLFNACVSVDKEMHHPHQMTFRTFATKTATGVETGTLPNTIGIYANRSSLPAGTDGGTAWNNSEYFHSVTPDFPYGQYDKLYLNDVCFAKFGNVYSGANADNIVESYPYYWPSSGSLLFAAYAPHISQSQTKIKDVYIRNHKDPKDQGYMSIHVVMDAKPSVLVNPEVQAENNPSFELFYADSKNVGTNLSLNNETQAVPILMKHAMSKVTFKFSDPQREFKISGKLLHVLNSAWFYSGKTPGWVPYFNDPVNNLTRNIILQFNTGNNNFKDEILLTPDAVEVSMITIPMQLNGIYPSVTQNLDKHVILKLTLKNEDNFGHMDKLVDMSTITSTWKPGMHYIYNITATPEDIIFDKPIIVNRDHEIKP